MNEPMENTLRRWWPLFVLPTMAAFAVGFLWPCLSGLYLSFCRFTTISNAVFVGLENYVRAFGDSSSRFVHALWFTALFSALSTVVINVAGLAVALALVMLGAPIRAWLGFKLDVIVVWISVFFTVVSAVDYIRKNISCINFEQI